MTKTAYTATNAAEFIKDCNLQEEFNEWAGALEEDEVEEAVIEFAENHSREFEAWAEANLYIEAETEPDYEGEYWEAKYREQKEDELF